jgi:hypothetical protein
VRKLCAALLVAGVAASAAAHPGSAIVVDRRGTVYFVDTGSGVWMVPPGGALTRHPGPAFHWMALDEGGRFAKTALPSTPDRPLQAAGNVLLSSDYSIEIGSDGALYFAEFSGGTLRMIRFTADGKRSVRATLPGPSEWINGIAAGPDGAIYYTEHRAVRKIDARGNVTTVLSNVEVPKCAQIPGTEPGTEPYLRGIAIGGDGSLYVAAAACGALLKISGGKASVLLRTAAPWSPTDVAFFNGSVYVLEYTHTASDNRREWLPRVRKIAPNGTVSTIAAITGR